MRLRIRRGLASFLACSLMLGVVYLALLGVWSQAVGCWAEMPNYSKRITELVDSATLKVKEVQRSLEEALIPPRLRRIQLPEPPANNIVGEEQEDRPARPLRRAPCRRFVSSRSRPIWSTSSGIRCRVSPMLCCWPLSCPFWSTSS